jgi:hypothetical protein
MMAQFAEAIAPDFTLEPYYGGTLFKQGTELVALQRGNLQMGRHRDARHAHVPRQFVVLLRFVPLLRGHLRRLQPQKL